MSATASIEWPHNPKAYIAVNPAKRKKLGVLLGVMALLVCIADIGVEPLLSHIGKEMDRPAMELAAQRGNKDAQLWLAKKYYKTEGYRIAKLSADGYPPAEYLEGLITLRSNKVEGNRLIDKAAAEGSVEAIRYRQDTPASK